MVVNGSDSGSCCSCGGCWLMVLFFWWLGWRWLGVGVGLLGLRSGEVASEKERQSGCDWWR